MFADLVADVLPAQAHRRHDALGRQLEGQILENRGERRRALRGCCGRASLASGGAVQAANARANGADGPRAVAVRLARRGPGITNAMGRLWRSYTFRGSRFVVAILHESQGAQGEPPSSHVVHRLATRRSCFKQGDVFAWRAPVFSSFSHAGATSPETTLAMFLFIPSAAAVCSFRQRRQIGQAQLLYGSVGRRSFSAIRRLVEHADSHRFAAATPSGRDARHPARRR